MDKINPVGIIGAGVMGKDLALDLAIHGYNIALVDNSESAFERFDEAMKLQLNTFKMLRPSLKATQIAELLSRIKCANDLNSLENAELIIENVSEDIDVKSTLYKQLNNICTQHPYYFVNTSCISITKIASLTSQPEKVIGTHFLNPVPLKDIVEVIKGHFTSEDTLSFTKTFLKSLNKSAVVVNDSSGFVVNRLSHLFMNEAAFLVQESVAQPKEIDILFRKGYGHSMGPLQTADLIGIDTVVNSLNVLYEAYQDPKFRCCPLLIKMVDAGLLGRKTGQGFYSY